MSNVLPQRKHPRLKNYDYSTVGFYFVTVCTQGKKPILGRIECKNSLQSQPTVGRLALKPPQSDLIMPEDVFLALSPIGAITEHYIRQINAVYKTVKVDCYVVMPDHIHLLLQMLPDNGGLRASRPTVQTVVRSLKRLISTQAGCSIWQKSFYEHIIRSEDDLRETRAYIINNPAKKFFERRA